MADGRFATETDAYKFGISYAIAAGLDPDEAPPGGYNTKFNAGGGLTSTASYVISSMSSLSAIPRGHMRLPKS